MSRDLFVKHFASEPRIAKRVEDIVFDGTSGCWLWPATGHYPQVWLGEGRGYVHRISLEIKSGSPLGGLEARHQCDTPLCVNPDHLIAGSHADNMRDMRERGRHATNPARGIRNNKATVTDAEVVEALTLLASGASLSAVGRIYGVKHSTVAAWRDGTYRSEARDAWLNALPRAS